MTRCREGPWAAVHQVWGNGSERFGVGDAKTEVVIEGAIGAELRALLRSDDGRRGPEAALRSWSRLFEGFGFYALKKLLSFGLVDELLGDRLGHPVVAPEFFASDKRPEEICGNGEKEVLCEDFHLNVDE